MSAFLTWFEDTFGAPFPVSLACDLREHAPGVFTSPGLAIEAPPMRPEFLDQDYVIAGAWGHGVNSYAFYFVERRGAHQRFFRIQSGGAYVDPEEAAADVVRFLGAYERWRVASEGAMQSSTLINDMGACRAELPRGHVVDADEDDFFEVLRG